MRVEPNAHPAAAPTVEPATQPDAAATTRPDGSGQSADAPTTQPDAPGLAPLRLVLPKPAFSGTPKNVPPGTTVERPTGKPRPPFLVPAGVTNMALNKPVTVSDKEPVIGEPALITDGDKEADDGSYIELGPGVQWARIDLERTVEIYAVLVWHFHGDPRVYHDVIVQVADDAEFVTNVRTLFNNDHDNSAGLGAGKDREYFETFEGKLVPGGRVRARYVRLTSNGSTASEMNHYTEVEVHGRAVE